MSKNILTTLMLVFVVSACSPDNNKTLRSKYENGKSYNIINLSQSVSRVIDNDTLEVILVISNKNKDRQVSMNKVNERLNFVMKEIKSNPSFEAQLLNRSGREISQNLNNERDGKGNPIYTQLWEENSQILVKSKDISAMNSMLSRLQQVASISGMTFTVSRERIKSLEDELTRESIQKFNKRANLIVKEFGGKNYKVVSVNVGNVDNSFHPKSYINFRSGVSKLESASMVSDSLPGERTINLYIEGSIEIER